MNMAWLRLGSALALALAVLLAPREQALAAWYTGPVTGYAFGNASGQGGTINVGAFANHSNQDRPLDPAAWWPMGTSITMVSPSVIYFWDGYGNVFTGSTFILRDVGDIYCRLGYDWADIYGGRNAYGAHLYPACSCQGSPSPGYCWAAYHDNCQDAINFGNYNRTYNGP